MGTTHMTALSDQLESIDPAKDSRNSWHNLITNLNWYGKDSMPNAKKRRREPFHRPTLRGKQEAILTGWIYDLSLA